MSLLSSYRTLPLAASHLGFKVLHAFINAVVILSKRQNKEMHLQTKMI